MEEDLEKLFYITTCPHEIFLHEYDESRCADPTSCKVGAHNHCDCPLPCKVPLLELEWLYYQRIKSGEDSLFMMGGNDRDETRRQNKAEKRKLKELEVKEKKRKKQEEKQIGLQLSME